MIQKRIISIFLSICFLFISNTFVISDTNFKIKLDNVSAEAGKEFKVNLSLENNPGVSGITLKLKFDKSVIKPVSFENKNGEFTGLANISSPDIDYSSIDTIDVTFDSTNNVTTDGIIGTFTFFALNDVNVFTSSINLTANKGDIFDSSLNDVNFLTVDGTVTFKNIIWNGIYGDADADNILSANDASIVLQKVLDRNFKMNIEEKTKDYMNYIDVDKNNILTAFDAATILKKVLNKTFLMPIESDKNATESITTTEVTTKNTETTTEMNTEMNTEMTTIKKEELETLTETSTETTTENKEFKIKLDSTSADIGKEFKINLTLENNPGIAGLTLKLKFDKNVIKPISFENMNSKFTSLSNISSPDIDYNSIDTIDVTFDSTNNVTDDGIIGTVTFCVIDNVSTTNSIINLIGNKGDIFDSELNDIEFYTEDGIIILKNVVVENNIETTTSTKESSFEFNSDKGMITKFLGTESDVVIPDTINGISVTSIGTSAFSLNSEVKSVIIPKSVKSIGFQSFFGCSALENVVIPEGVERIEYDAFNSCWVLPKIKLPNSLKYIGRSAFHNCNTIKEMTIPENVSNITLNPFSSCNSLENINVESDNLNYCSENGIVFNKSKTKLIAYPNGRTGVYRIPDNVTEIGESAFDETYGLTEIVIPSSVKTIGQYAFNSCCKIKSIIIPKNIENIGENIFLNCSKITIYCEKGSVADNESLYPSDCVIEYLN